MDFNDFQEHFRTLKIEELSVGNNAMLAFIAMNDPSIVMSQNRNIGFSEDPIEEGREDFDVVYDVVIVVRNSPDLFAHGKEIENLYATARERIWLWTEVAKDIWLGEIDDHDIVLERHLPPKVGAPYITIFGTVIDQEGRAFSLTITDQTNVDRLYEMIRYQLEYVDYVSMLSNGVNMNKNGAKKHRYTTVVKKSKRKATAPKSKVSNSKKPVTKKANAAKSKPKIASKAQSKSETVQCEFIECVRDLEGGTQFTIPVHAALLNKDMVSFVCYTTDAKNFKVPDNKNTIYFYADNTDKSYDNLVEQLGDDADEIPIESTLLLRATKLISKNGNSYYIEGTLLKA